MQLAIVRLVQFVSGLAQEGEANGGSFAPQDIEIAANGIPAGAVTEGCRSLKCIRKCVIRVKDAILCDGL